jgi:hypothetical protein
VNVIVARTATGRDLDGALDAWADVPRVEREIDAWDWEEQVVFIHEWAVQEDRLARLDRAACDGSMTAEQRARYDTLQQLVALHRPIITRLRA